MDPDRPDLRDRYGPFILAYLEAIVRIADWRASAADWKVPELIETPRRRPDDGLHAGTSRHVLPGLRPEPLGSYLAGLGLIRVLGEQADPAATAAWTADGLLIATAATDIADG